LFQGAQPLANANRAAQNWPDSRRPPISSASRLPKMSKMFSFDTIDKVTANRVEPAFAATQPEVTLQLAGPDTVAVNQVFQQLVQVRNSTNAALHDVRVTQVCDLQILGADRPQAVVIESLEPGETKTVRFSARARMPGPFALRYVAENAEIQANVDDLVQVSPAGPTLQIDCPTAMQVDDGGDVCVLIHNGLSLDAAQLRVRCRLDQPAPLKVREHEASTDPQDGSTLIRLIKLDSSSDGTVRFRIAPTEVKPLRMQISLEDSTGPITSQSIEIAVLPRPQ
jgi:hypothetical protein